MERSEIQQQKQQEIQEEHRRGGEVITLMEDEIQAKQQTVFQYSAKVEVNAKGYCQPHVHIFSNDRVKMITETIDSLKQLVHGIKAAGFQVATDLAPKKELENE